MLPKLSPEIGVPRVYDGPELPLLYPGEFASAIVRADATEAIDIAEGLARAINDGFIDPAIDGWTVEPVPGIAAALQRSAYKYVFRWVERFVGRPRLSIGSSIERVKAGDGQ